MATAKKATAKKSVKKVAARKAPVASKVKKPVYKSFRLSTESTPFLQFLITEQTIYWSILLVLILGLGIWVLNLQMNITNILESINTTV